MAESYLMGLLPALFCAVKAALYASKIAPLVVVLIIGVALFGFRGRNRN
ncbi:MAG: hypothetical protein LAN36_07715 [Acidobacteriia bacterium]|nr:hypothetical protein [Terriglobia bacterium]